mgnify:CR=1 FL=1
MGSRTLGSGNNGQCGLVVQVGRDGGGTRTWRLSNFLQYSFIQPRIMTLMPDSSDFYGNHCYDIFIASRHSININSQYISKIRVKIEIKLLPFDPTNCVIFYISQ